MEIGGIERSLINMLESFDYSKFNVDLMIFHHTGEFMKLIPNQVNVLPENKKYTIIRKSFKQCLKERCYIPIAIRTLCKLQASILAKFRGLEEGSGYIEMQLSSKYLSNFMPKMDKNYDLAISYAWPHDITEKNVNARRKIAWIHTDYSKLEVDIKIDLEVWEKYDFIASISEACTEAFLTKYPSLKEKIILVENINSPEFIKKMAIQDKQDVFKDNYFNIVSVGRLSYVKGFDNAVNALKILHDKGFTNIKWYVVGYGGFELELRKLIKQFGMENSFILLGKKINPYVFIKACDLYVQPSRYEGKAVTVTEAKILGKPILITNYPTAGSQVIEGKEGIICDQSVEGLVNGIQELYRNEELRQHLIKNNDNHNHDNSNLLNNLYEVIS
ncbi:glycosyl transferase [Fictibacillus arsenicus]|uniref:Glycosyl transferase n=2 Tax=Fictibacillus arsenicus TaxID=255247 RepID=A0A1V3GDQ9_9BACL|nr:glycosyl transferase [Fictibacillus arsenicus]